MKRYFFIILLCAVVGICSANNSTAIVDDERDAHSMVVDQPFNTNYYRDIRHIDTVEAIRGGGINKRQTLYIYTAYNYADDLVYLGSFEWYSHNDYDYRTVKKTEYDDYRYSVHLIGPAWYFNSNKIRM